jgi:hypothetical protein
MGLAVARLPGSSEGNRKGIELKSESNYHRWGVILAGGDGVRLRSLTRLVSGDDRPKQFSPLLEGRTLLAQASSVIDREGALVGVQSIEDVVLTARVEISRKDVSYEDVENTCKAMTKEAVVFLNYAFIQPTQHLIYPHHRDPLPSLRWCNRTLEEAQ